VTDLPQQLREFLAEPNPAVIATVPPGGQPHTAATWYLVENARVLVNMGATRKRLANMRHDPRVSLTVIGRDDWYHQVTLRGRAVEIEDDRSLAGIDRLSRHYTGHEYPRRDQHRVNAWLAIDSWYGWAGGAPWTG
jgi:PPOX class probable F420-dependent enzyme